MKFRTQVPILKGEHLINYQSKIMLLGSCFVVNIGEKLGYYQFQHIVNPFGILFHPLAIEKLFYFIQTNKEFSEKDIFYHNERWHCFDVHSDLSDGVAERLIFNLNEQLRMMRESVVGASHIIVTLGTAWVYKQVGTDCYVANCHKVPHREFVKELLGVDMIVRSLRNITNIIEDFNPLVQIIFTVSPVRHIKDGFVENQVSKSRLISAIYELTSGRKGGSGYFPSYEIMMDELRDYRFYMEDMLHPNGTAVDYIWERFRDTWIDPTAFDVMEQVAVIERGKGHRPFNINSEEYQKFRIGLLQKIECLVDRFPFMRF